MSLAPNSPLHFISRFLKNHFPVNLSRSKSQEVSNILGISTRDVLEGVMYLDYSELEVMFLV
jgi:hypothetical protein